VTTVPNPFATRPSPEANSPSKPLAPVSTQKKFPTHGFGTSQPTLMQIVPSNVRPFEAEARTDKIRDSLNSKPHCGKKGKNLGDLERIELAQTRKRKHAKSTKTKKKARLEELIDTERKY